MSDCSSENDLLSEFIPSTLISSKLSTGISDANCIKKAPRMRFKNCAICGIIKNTVSFHRFPVTPDIRAQWAAFCGLDVEKLGSSPVICDNHFTEDDFMEHQFFHGNKNLLKKNTIPSRNPPKRHEVHVTEDLTYETFVVDNFSNISAYPDDEVSIHYAEENECDVASDDDLCNVNSDDATVATSSENQTRPRLICKRKFPRYFMDIKREDVCSPKYAKLCLEMGRQAIFNYRRKINTLQHQNKRLQNKLLSAEDIIRRLKNDSISMGEALNTIETKQIFKFGNKGCFI